MELPKPSLPCICVVKLQEIILTWLEDYRTDRFRIPCLPNLYSQELSKAQIIEVLAAYPPWAPEDDSHVLVRGHLLYHNGVWQWVCTDNKTGAFMAGISHETGVRASNRDSWITQCLSRLSQPEAKSEDPSLDQVMRDIAAQMDGFKP